MNNSWNCILLIYESNLIYLLTNFVYFFLKLLVLGLLEQNVQSVQEKYQQQTG